MRRVAVFFAFLICSLPSLAQVSITLWQPQYGFAVIPSETRRYYATVTNGTTNGVTWSTSGGTIIGGPFSSGWVDVQAPASGSTCSYSGTSPSYVISSDTSFTITATSQDDNTKSSTITVNVCSPAVSINLVPGYRVLYSGQQAELQGFIWGSVNKSVTWSLTAQPVGGDGTLADTNKADTVFSATVAGRYTVTATSSADGTKTATAILYVTGHSMPYTTTPNHTEPVDCTADPNNTGTVYDVGPSQTYTTIGAVPWATLTAGSTVRIHNEDTSGTSPTTYHEYFNVYTQATQTNGVRVCGVPDSFGNLPVVDGTNATSTTNPSNYTVGTYLAEVYNNNYANYGSPNTSPAWISIEGIKFQNANATLNYYIQGQGTTTRWGVDPHGDDYGAFVACIRFQNGFHLSLIGVEATGCGIGIFTEAVNPESKMSRWVLVEGNNMHGDLKGRTKSTTETGGIHTLYMQSFGQVVQGNFAGDADPTGVGGDFKNRGAWTVLRYNYLNDGSDSTTRTVDEVDNQDAPAYVSPEQYLKVQGSANDAVPMDTLAAWYEAWHDEYQYGNIEKTTVLGPVHFNADHDTQYGGVPRYGHLWSFFNTGYLLPVNYSSGWFDTGNPNLGSQMPEFQQVESYDNIIWQDGTSTSANPFFSLSTLRSTFIDSGETVVPSTCCTNNQTSGGYGSGWPASGQTTTNYFAGADNLSAHLTGFGTSGSALPTTVSSRPFNTTTLAPSGVGVATSLPSALANYPVRFQPDAVNGYMVPRTDSLANVGAVGGGGPVPNSNSAPQMLLLQ